MNYGYAVLESEIRKAINGTGLDYSFGEEYGLIDRKATQGHPLKVEYTLTKKGNTLNSVLAHMAEFSFQYEPEKIFKDKKPRHVKQYFGTDILSEIYD